MPNPSERYRSLGRLPQPQIPQPGGPAPDWSQIMPQSMFPQDRTKIPFEMTQEGIMGNEPQAPMESNPMMGGMMPQGAPPMSGMMDSFNEQPPLESNPLGRRHDEGPSG